MLIYYVNKKKALAPNIPMPYTHGRCSSPLLIIIVIFQYLNTYNTADIERLKKHQRVSIADEISV